MYEIECVLGHKRKDARPRGVCEVCGNELAIRKKKAKAVEKPQEESDG